MATLTIRVPDEVAAAATVFDDVDLTPYTIAITVEHMARNLLLRVSEQTHAIAEAHARPEPDELREVAAELARCAEALEASNDDPPRASPTH